MEPFGSFIGAVLVVRLVVGLHELVVVASVLMFPRARAVVWSVVSDRVCFCGRRWCVVVVGSQYHVLWMW